MIEDHSDKLLSAVEQRTQDLLEVASAMVESTAIDLALVDTGYYRGSIFHEIIGNTARVGAHAEYAVYIEMKYKPVLRMALTANLHNIERLFHEKAI